MNFTSTVLGFTYMSTPIVWIIFLSLDPYHKRSGVHSQGEHGVGYPLEDQDFDDCLET